MRLMRHGVNLLRREGGSHGDAGPGGVKPRQRLVVMTLAIADAVAGLVEGGERGEQDVGVDLLGFRSRPIGAEAHGHELGAADKRIGFAVDEILSEQEVLVKNLGKPLLRVRNVAGATVLQTGTPAVILNVADLLKSAVRPGAAAGARAAAGAAPAATPEIHARRILVADDSVTSRMLLKNILESSGYQVATAVDGMDALTALKTREFDLVVSDVEMPRMDGFDLTSKIRADKKLAELPVVLVTALGSREHQERGIDVGADAYIVKSSFDQKNLLEVIRKLV